MNVHEAPRTEEERCELLRLIADQEGEIFEDVTLVTCPGCKRKIRLRRGYRCFFCELVFCKTCAARHFGPAGGGQGHPDVIVAEDPSREPDRAAAVVAEVRNGGLRILEVHKERSRTCPKTG